MPYNPRLVGSINIRANPPITRALSAGLGQVFRSAWLGEPNKLGIMQPGAYSNISETQLKLPTDTTKQKFIEKTIAEEINAWQSNPNIRYYCLSINNRLAGMLSIEVKNRQNDSSIYIRQLAIAAPYQKSGLGNIFLDYLHTSFPAIKKFNILTRKINAPAIHFYKKNGYHVDSTFSNPHYPTDTYIAMSKKQ